MTSILYTQGLFVTVGSYALNTAAMFISSDGVTWTQRNAGVSTRLASVCFGDGKFVAVGTGGKVLVSSNGWDWSQSVISNIFNLESVTYGNGRFVAVGASVFCASPDAVDWTSQINTNAVRLQAVAFGNNRFVALNAQPDAVPGLRIWISEDGLDWAPQGATTGRHYWITFAAGRFFISPSNAVVLSSTDGVTWITNSLPNPGVTLWGMGYGNGTFLAVGAANQNQHIVMRSEDGIHWQTQILATGGGPFPVLYAAAYGVGTFVVAGNTKPVAQSDNVARPYFRPPALAGTNIELHVTGEIGRAYRLQISATLDTWDDYFVYTNDLPSMNFTVPRRTNMRFFRAESP